MNFEQLVKPIGEILDKLKNKYSNLEVEGRLGIYDAEEGYFDTNIGEEYYNKIKDLLESCNEWNNKENTKVTDYFSGPLRLSISNKGTQRCVEKKKIATYTFVNEKGLLDLRITISTEIPKKVSNFPDKKENLRNREKSRKTYQIGDYNFDLTQIITKDNPESNEADEYFEFEVEYNNIDDKIKTHDSPDIIWNILLKLLDASFACENFIKTKENNHPETNIYCVKEKIIDKTI